MSDQADNIVLVYLRRLDGKLDRVLEEIGVKTRLSIIGAGLANVRSEIAGLHHAHVAVQVELDRTNKRLDRIERRLHLQDAHP